ncbi:hypothetical protein [Lacticaseibacillus hulanensis]|uniref:hypothetical protein n=1 Tax=Lacticaseibacillus hulanensis TaxID=2493111 RepID=UPI000FD6D6F0|nr:hypothetical protein [Lacticaseibacillus hulanensis]
MTDGHTAIADLTQADLAKFRSICQIRYSGTLNVDFYGNPSIFDSIAGFGVCRNINRGTLAIEFDPQGNAEAPFAERCADWQKFEERYQPNNLDVR